MATASFDEKVIVTNPKTIAMMSADLDSTVPVEHKKNNEFTVEKAEETSKKLAMKLLHSVR